MRIPNKLQDFKEWEFSSGSTTGADFKSFARKFKNHIKKNLPSNSEIVNCSADHYELSGFVKQGNRYVYFSIPDVRYERNGWLKNILVRTAKHEKDYTGGGNNYTDLKNFKTKVGELLDYQKTETEKETDSSDFL